MFSAKEFLASAMERKKQLRASSGLHPSSGEIYKIWMRILRKKLVRLCVKRGTNESSKLLLLPDDIVIDILCRLSLKSALVCRRVCKSLREIMSTPNFNATLLIRSTPIAIVQCESLCSTKFSKRTKHRSYHNILCVVDRFKTIVKASTTLSSSYRDDRGYVSSLVGSYHGFLLFKPHLTCTFFLFNPVTQEQVLLTSPGYWYEECGLYFHAPTGEYRFLYAYCRTWGPYRFFVLSLRSKLVREISNCTLAPCTCRSPVILNGSLHWMVSVGGFRCSFRKFHSCSDSIMVFNTEKEDFMTMLHPDSCCLKDRRRVMQLLELDGHLCLCDTSLSAGQVYLWLLEDYRNKVWIKCHTINIEFAKPAFLSIITFHRPQCVQAVQICNDELLLKIELMGLFHYHLELKTVTKIEREGFQSACSSTMVVHTNTLACLDCDSVISLSKF